MAPKTIADETVNTPARGATYKCAHCKEEFPYGWSEEEALAEKTANGFDEIDCDIVCDDCYNMIMGIKKS